MDLIDKIDKKRLPKHIAIIMDGNGRWAKKRSKEHIFGHINGVVSVKKITEACSNLGIKFLTLYAFSTENWNRPKQEVDAIMDLLYDTIHNETKNFMDNNIRLMVIGNLELLNEKCYNNLMKAIEQTSANTKMTLVLALSYSSRWEIVNTTKIIAEKVKNNDININDINDDLFSSYLTTASIPEPELLIRTSGEYRISNFLLWQIAYTELYFTPKLWPDFREDDLYEAIIDFQGRERRFGKTSEQLNNL
ncbi:MAG: isoprenyl transferase [Bacteroidales bacterium]|nr:isoprenyl transferase [Bacteroidales bacterium]